MNTGTPPEQFYDQPTHHNSTRTYRSHNWVVLIGTQNISVFYHQALLERKTSVTIYSHYKVLKLANRCIAPF